MKFFRNQIIVVFVVFISFACRKKAESPAKTYDTSISFGAERSNSVENYTSKVSSFVLKNKGTGWLLNSENKIELTREVEYTVQLENGHIITFGFWFIKREMDDSQLILLDHDSLSYNRRWNYITTDLETERFYKGFDEARVLVNNNVIFHNSPNENFKIETEKVIVNNKQQSYVTIYFQGTAYGFYDPFGEFQEVFHFSGGTYKGILP
ncbi:MAG: hypothetical protein ACK40G_12300 [Cytophagaceae bacterium]